MKLLIFLWTLTTLFCGIYAQIGYLPIGAWKEKAGPESMFAIDFGYGTYRWDYGQGGGNGRHHQGVYDVYDHGWRKANSYYSNNYYVRDEQKVYDYGASGKYMNGGRNNYYGGYY